MRARRTALSSLWALAIAALPAAAADTLPSAYPERLGAQGHVGLAITRVTRGVDVRGEDDAGRPVDAPGRGRYAAARLDAEWRAAERLWLGGTLSGETLDDGQDSFRFHGVEASALARLREADGPLPAIALRGSVGLHRAGTAASSTPLRVPGAVLDTVTVRAPSDRHWQLDLIGTWQPRPALDLTAAFGFGQVRVGYHGLSATTTRNGCRYRLQFRGNDIYGTLAEPCAAPAVIEQFYDSSGAYGVDVDRELAWHGRFARATLALAWYGNPWTLRAGFSAYRIRRGAVDDIAAARSQPVYRSTRTVTLEAGYRLTARTSVVLGLESRQHLLLDELPLAYNSGTTRRFGARLTQGSIGLRTSF